MGETKKQRLVRNEDRFYGDPVVRFEAMANSASEAPIDAVHFRMWCRIAANEIKTARAALKSTEAQS